MSRLPTCLLAVLFSILVGACAPGGVTVTDFGSAVAFDDPDASPTTGFVPVDDERGPAWVWITDPTLQVTLPADSSSPGLHVEHGDRSLSFDADFGDGPSSLPVLLVGARADGTDPLAADRSPGLHLLLAGSTEHGCPADDLELDLQVTPAGRQVQLDVHISGMPYLALQPQGTITVIDDQGTHTVDAAQHVADGGDLQLSGFRSLRAEGSDLGTVSLTADQPLPWFQLQGHSGLVEVDMDHSCEAEPPMFQAELDLRLTL